MKHTVTIWLKGLVAALVTGFSGGISTALGMSVADPKTFNMGEGLGATLKLAAMAGLINAILGVSAYLKQAPVPADDAPVVLPPALPPAVLLLFILLIPSTASASAARIVLSCTSSTSVYVAETDKIIDVCSDPDVYLDAGITFDGVVLQMNRPREIVVGFSAGLGYGLRWSPVWWTYTPSLISVDLFAGGGYAVEDKALTVSLLLKLTLIDWIGVGAGFAHSFGLADQPDATRWLTTYGVAKSF